MKDLAKAIEETTAQLNAIIPDLDMRVVDYVITPIIRVNSSLAAALLEKNHDNRNLNKRRVSFYSKQMQNGEWKPNGENIKFSAKGVLMDGQHRLQAITSLDNTSINLEVRLDIDPDDFSTIDTGKSRNFTDVLSVLRIPNHNIVAPAIKLYFLYVNKRMDTLQGVTRTNIKGMNQPNTKSSSTLGFYHIASAPSNLQLEDLFYLNRNIGEYVYTSKMIKTISTPAEICFLYYVFSKKDKELATDFIYKLVEGENLEQGDTIKILRDKLQENTMKKVMKFSSKERLALIIKTWNYLRAGKTKIRCVNFDVKEDEFPYAK